MGHHNRQPDRGNPAADGARSCAPLPRPGKAGSKGDSQGRSRRKDRDGRTDAPGVAMVCAMTEYAAGRFPVTTGFEVPGMVVERDLGVAFGLVVRSMGFAKSFGASLTALRQGEVPQYTQLLEDSRRHAIDRMVENAKLLGGNAVVAMRFDSSEIGQQLTEIVAYGTAVVVGPAGS